ncbi:hypothetical protein GJAV_G00192770 [Gymnothorax javanicus]|nr:hypothetical protein GJAV_G00192770 [Gymnothorax javanicus]
MAPRDIQQQTYEIINCLFDPTQSSSEFKTLNDIESDFPEDNDDSFDPVVIADHLREIGDQLDEKVLNQYKSILENAAQKQVEAAFKTAVDALSKTWMPESGDVATERYLLKATVALGLYVNRNCPRIVSTIQGVMANYINTYLAPWINQQGGWGRVAPEI